MLPESWTKLYDDLLLLHYTSTWEPNHEPMVCERYMGERLRRFWFRLAHAVRPCRGTDTAFLPLDPTPFWVAEYELKCLEQWLEHVLERYGTDSSVPQTWYPLCTSDQIRKPGSVQRSQIDDVGFCVYRDRSGIVRCVSDVCPHRGAPLSMGKVVDDRIACPYHGFQFDPLGLMRFVPSDPGCSEHHCPSCPTKPILPVYTVRERAGFVWVWYDPDGGEPNCTPTLPLPVTPELEDPNWYLTYGKFEFDAPWQPVFENALDNSHIHFLHGSSFGNEEAPVIRNMKTRAVSDTVSEATFTLTNKPVNAWWNWTAVPEVHVTARAYLPSVSTIRFELGGGISFLTYVATVPVSANKTVNRYVLARTRFPGKIWDPMARSAMDEIFSEDKAMVERLYPSHLYEERSVRADALQLIWRKQVRAFVWGDVSSDAE